MLNIAIKSRRGRPAHGLPAKTYGTAGLVAGMLACSLVQATVAPAASRAVPSDRSVWAWGSNDQGQMLDVLTRDRYTPVPVLHGVTDFALGDRLGVAVVDGQVWTWGGPSNFGSDPSFKPVATPHRVPGRPTSPPCRSATTTSSPSTTAGHVWTWGAGAQGQLGLGSTDPAEAPTRLEQSPPDYRRSLTSRPATSTAWPSTPAARYGAGDGKCSRCPGRS